MLGRPFVHFAGLWEKKEGRGKERILNYAWRVWISTFAAVWPHRTPASWPQHPHLLYAAEFGWFDKRLFKNQIGGKEGMVGWEADPSLCGPCRHSHVRAQWRPPLGCPHCRISCLSWASLGPALWLFPIHPIVGGPGITERDSRSRIQPQWSSQGIRVSVYRVRTTEDSRVAWAIWAEKHQQRSSPVGRINPSAG